MNFDLIVYENFWSLFIHKIYRTWLWRHPNVTFFSGYKIIWIGQTVFIQGIEFKSAQVLNINRCSELIEPRDNPHRMNATRREFETRSTLFRASENSLRHWLLGKTEFMATQIPPFLPLFLHNYVRHKIMLCSFYFKETPRGARKSEDP